MSSNAGLREELKGLIDIVEKGLEDLKKLKEDVRSTHSTCNNMKAGFTGTGALGVCASILASVCSFVNLNRGTLIATGSAMVVTIGNVPTDHVCDTKNRFVSLVFLIFHCDAISMFLVFLLHTISIIVSQRPL